MRAASDIVFDQLAMPLILPESSRDLLAAAALLHDVGYMVAFRQHHKHSYHLIAHAPLDGFTPAEREIIALSARYHCRVPPSKKHESWASLPREGRSMVCRLSALLRIADGLDRRHSQALQDLTCRVSRGKLRQALVSDCDLAVEIHAAEEKADMFREVFALELAIDVDRARQTARSIRSRSSAPAARRARLRGAKP